MRKVYLLIIVGFFISCEEEGSGSGSNPYDDWGYIGGKDSGYGDKPIDASTIVGIQRDVFSPTCANSGCHDGLFEPDFRTVEASYNSLINRIPIKNTPDSAYKYRVIPGNADGSILIQRLIQDLNGNSGIMPLSLEPGSDWLDKKEEYIENIKKWINDGAKDQYGNLPTSVDFPPVFNGCVGYIGGNLVKRSGNYGVLSAKKSDGGMEVWFSYTDDNTAISSFTKNTISYTKYPYGWDSAYSANMQVVGTPKMEKNFARNSVPFYHKVYIPFTNFEVDDVIWLRTSVSDNVNATIQLPNDNSLFNYKQYSAIRIE